MNLLDDIDTHTTMASPAMIAPKNEIRFEKLASKKGRNFCCLARHSLFHLMLKYVYPKAKIQLQQLLFRVQRQGIIAGIVCTMSEQ